MNSRESLMKSDLNRKEISPAQKEKIKQQISSGREPKTLKSIINIQNDENLSAPERKKKIIKQFKEYLEDTYNPVD